MAKMDQMRVSRPWRIALGVSVILNLFFVAIIGGHVWRARMGGLGGRPPFAAALARAEAGLSPDDAKAFDAAIRRGGPQYIAAARQLRHARLAVRDQVMAENFDPKKTQEALASWQTAWTGFLGAFDGSLVEALAQVSPEGRRKLVAQRRVEPLSP